MPPCPCCQTALRPFAGRLCCDRCDGIFLAVADLVQAVDELVKIEPVVGFTAERAGGRKCPQCGDAMRRCHIALEMLDKVVAPKVELDRCPAHGLWFDEGDLARVFLAVEREFGSHGGSSGPTGPGDDGPLGSYGKFNAPP